MSPAALQRHVPWVLAAAFSLSVVHTVYAWLHDLADPDFTVTTPTTYLFYALGFGSAWLARRPSRRARSVLLAYLVAVLGISVFYYPTTFEPSMQTTFAWFENDVYVGLLCVAAYLTVAGLFRPGPGDSGPVCRAQLEDDVELAGVARVLGEDVEADPLQRRRVRGEAAAEPRRFRQVVGAEDLPGAPPDGT